MYTTLLNPSNDITPRGMKELHKENGYSNNDQTNMLESSKSTITPQQRFQHAQNPFPSFQSLPTEFQKIFSTCYEIKRTCTDISKLHGQDDPNVVKLATQINHLESLLFGMDSNSVQTNSLPSSSTSIYHQSSPPSQTGSSSSTNFGNNGSATATVVNITNYQYGQQMSQSPALGAPLNPISDAAQNQFAHATSATQTIPVGIHAPLPYGGYRQPNNSYTSMNPPNAAVAAIVSMGMASSAPPTPPSNSYLVEKSEVNLDSDSDPESQNSPPGSKKRRSYGQPGFPLIQDKGRGRRQRAKAAPPLVGEDQLYCRACGETQTCEWRRGPDGYKSLCNACGIHYAKIVKKEETAAQEYKPKSVGLSMLLNND